MKFSSLFASTLAIAIATCATACAPKAEAPAETAAAPAALPSFAESADVKPFTLGSLQAAALRDGFGQIPNDNKVVAINKTKAEVDAVLTAAGLPTDTIEVSIQPLLVRSADRIMLFDTGAAGTMGPTAGKLPASLAAAGVDPASITDIFISHGHGDHIGGLVTPDGTAAFPNAAIHVSAAEWASINAQAPLAPIVAAVSAKVVEFQPGTDVVPGVKAVIVNGHTPGHSAYEITSDGQSLLYIGDTMHHSAISVQHPDWRIAFDSDAPTAEASRQALLERTAASGQRIYAVHFPFPGIGKFEKQSETFVWVAE